MIFLFISFVVILIGLYTYAYLSPKLDLKKSGSLYIYDNKDELLYQGSRNNEWANLSDISPYLVDAVISVEDKNFYDHHGFDYLRIAKAMATNIRRNKIVQGASTISQQYIKNLYLDFDKTWKRKIEEAFLTLELEVHYDKDDILEGYLNTINYGQGNMGIVNAASYYFNKKPNELTLEEAIMLAGIPKNPSGYNPVNNYEASVNRAKVVAKAMLNNKYIDEATYNNLYKEKIEIYGQNKTNNLQMVMYYQEAVLNELNNIKEIPTSLINSGGLKIYTNLDMEMQKNMEDAILSKKSDDEVQVASVVVNPDTGEVRALTGGIDYAKSQYNRALKSKRQVGSTMKPFLYYAALENNMTMASTFRSEETTFNLSNGKTYSPSNAGGIYASKEITMAAALSLSDNIYAVKTNLFLGVDKMIDVAKRTGINEELQGVASLPLGTSEINILDFATGYNTFATGGYKKDLYFIRKVTDLDGNVLYEHEDKKDLVINPNYTYILNEALTSTTNDAFVDYTTPTALNISGSLTHKYAIKTGSTNTDYWIVGYNPDALVMMWMGYDDNRECDKSVRNQAKKIWAEVIEDATKDKDDWYETPKNVVAIPLDAVTGNVPKDNNKTALYYFVKGSEPGVTPEQYVMSGE
ncbi:penicillin-binding protein 1A family [Clostridium sp. CAG:609]|nr:penicillin-binding protein 1A family [Clostridium sp. CAG:609]